MNTTSSPTIDIKALAEALETDARTTRRFLRSITPKDSHPGKGSRWAIEKKNLASLKKQFATYSAPAETE